ncbi:DUF3556 domain-containing protein [Pseudonocardia spinosispora]|uniref:DUF3556 domain-containing protein n=1 Tax=Pseudonocardia spinosispora TaxID=103441 RepID=UPI000418B71D|nr:DUF3556 domain-containing protein [Pseudonocardia spinosispora]
MGFLSPKMPPFNVHFWHWGRRSERIRPLCQHWGEHGIGLPVLINLLYWLKLVGYLAGALLFITATPGIGPLAEIGTWWTQPVVFQKLVIWSLLFEVCGLGSGSGPLTARFLPPVGGPLYWLRPKTVRLPPWPRTVPFTRGTYRTWFDVVLFAGMLSAAVWALLSPADVVGAGSSGTVTMLGPVALLPLALLVPLVGLRDKTIFVAARSEVYWLPLLMFLLPFADMIVAAKILLILTWWAAGTSKLDKTFKFCLAAQVSQTLISPRPLRRSMFRRFPDDMLPSWRASLLAKLVPLIEFTAPLVLLLSTNRTVTLAAVGVLATFHLLIILMIPMGGLIEWNAYLLFALVYLFIGHSGVSLASAEHSLVPVLVTVLTVTLIVWGNLRPDHVSYLMAMRYYTGNWAVSMWAFRPEVLPTIDSAVVKYGGFAKSQLKHLFGEQVAEVLAHKFFTFRSLYPHGRALFGLIPRAAGADHESYYVAEGEIVAHAIVGWSCGDGHIHNEQLLGALQERCHFQPGDVRLIVLESAPFGSDRQEYRLVDGATGEIERGHVLVGDLVNRQPWEVDNLPVRITRQVDVASTVAVHTEAVPYVPAQLDEQDTPDHTPAPTAQAPLRAPHDNSTRLHE